MDIDIPKLQKGPFAIQIGGTFKKTLSMLPEQYFGPTIKALSWKQPYATLMFHNKVETRKWNTAYRGWVLICTSKKRYFDSQVWSISGQYNYQIIQKILQEDISGCIDGMAIGIGYLAGVSSIDSNRIYQTFVKNDEGLFGLHFTEVHRIKPFLFKGGQRWKNLTEEQIKQIEII